MMETDAFTDIVELCALLQCLGYTIKSLNTIDVNASQDGGSRTVAINCQSSGLQVVLESGNPSCSCPINDQQNSGIWQVSGIAGGKQHDKEYGSTLLRSIPKLYQERMTKELQEMIRGIKSLNESDAERPMAINKSASMIDLGKNTSNSIAELSKEGINKSASILELGTPKKRNTLLKAETPSHHRSLDALTSAEAKEEMNPPFRMIQRQLLASSSEDAMESKGSFKTMCHRQSTYTISSTPGSVRRRNKTSSPIQAPANNVLDNLIEAEKIAENLRNKLSYVIREFMEDGKDESSISSMLDVSKISVLKAAETSKAQFASSPNLSGLGAVREDFTKSKLKRYESASTSNLRLKLPADKDSKSKLRRISPNIFKLKKDSTKTDKVQEGRSKLQSLFRPKIVTPVRVPKPNADPSPNLCSASKKKFSHVKSTIPRPTSISKKE